MVRVLRGYSTGPTYSQARVKVDGHDNGESCRTVGPGQRSEAKIHAAESAAASIAAVDAEV